MDLYLGSLYVSGTLCVDCADDGIKENIMNKPRRWREVTMEELNKVWKELEEKGVCYCGCTHAALLKIYGTNNLKHVMGHGWYKLTSS